jgi:hypothetical protein
MITVGYGDVTPVTTAERISVIVVTVISCGVFAYAVNSIGNIIKELDIEQVQFEVKFYS